MLHRSYAYFFGFENVDVTINATLSSIFQANHFNWPTSSTLDTDYTTRDVREYFSFCLFHLQFGHEFQKIINMLFVISHVCMCDIYLHV